MKCSPSLWRTFNGIETWTLVSFSLIYPLVLHWSILCGGDQAVECHFWKVPSFCMIKDLSARPWMSCSTRANDNQMTSLDALGKKKTWPWNHHIVIGDQWWMPWSPTFELLTWAGSRILYIKSFLQKKSKTSSCRWDQGHLAVICAGYNAEILDPMCVV